MLYEEAAVGRRGAAQVGCDFVQGGRRRLGNKEHLSKEAWRRWGLWGEPGKWRGSGWGAGGLGSD